MPNTDLENRVREEARAALEAIPGVRRAIVDGSPGRAYLLCEQGAREGAVEAAAKAVLARESGRLGPVELELAHLGPPRPAGRVRFLDLELRRPRAGVALATASLEWEGNTFRGEAEGEGGAPGELRVSALATVRALQAAVSGAVEFHLVGVKALRTFDTDLVAVLLHCQDTTERRLMGVSLVDDDGLHRSAALAVLNATNRLLGRYLRAGG